MNVLVVGYGSIGARHARILSELGCRVAVVSGREVDFPVVHIGLDQALATGQPDYVVIANATSDHYATLEQLAQSGYGGTVLVEKPLFGKYSQLPALPFFRTFVAYNLRFHPILRRLKALLEGERILSVQAYVGQYLPDWRPGTDYRTSYSASPERGGGVLRDLSHELDYLGWMLGKWQRLSALGGRVSSLEIRSEDVFAIMLEMEHCPVVTVQLNYLDRLARRSILVNTDGHTIEADLIKGTISVDRGCESLSVGRDDSYRAMHEAILSGDATAGLCTLQEGLETLRIIEMAERAAGKGEWVRSS